MASIWSKTKLRRAESDAGGGAFGSAEKEEEEGVGEVEKGLVVRR